MDGYGVLYFVVVLGLMWIVDEYEYKKRAKEAEKPAIDAEKPNGEAAES